MRRLYQKIYLTIIASLIAVVVVGGALWRFGVDTSPSSQAIDAVRELAAAALPPADAPPAVQRRALEHFASRLDVDMALFDPSLAPIAAVGRPLPPPRREGPRWQFGPGGPVWSVNLPDQRWLVARPTHVPPRHPALGFIVFLGGIALIVAVCAYPVVRGLTRRLERLQVGVETLGAGNLMTRVEVQGRDEVARLAESFNRAAARIQELVGAHRMLLANASHELRTPLSRIRLGIELFQKDGDPKYRAALESDIAELDALIDEILLSSRLDAARTPEAPETIDLLALAAEECARYDGCAIEGVPLWVRGDPRLVRRLIRNLLENARRHGKPPVRVELRQEDNRAVLDVMDAGPGVPDAERERVFAPFHRLGEAQGAGLGLALVRQIARLHGGDALTTARPDSPSCFRVTLPLSRG